MAPATLKLKLRLGGVYVGLRSLGVDSGKPAQRKAAGQLREASKIIRKAGELIEDSGEALTDAEDLMARLGEDPVAARSVSDLASRAVQAMDGVEKLAGDLSDAARLLEEGRLGPTIGRRRK